MSQCRSHFVFVIAIEQFVFCRWNVTDGFSRKSILRTYQLFVFLQMKCRWWRQRPFSVWWIKMKGFRRVAVNQPCWTSSASCWYELFFGYCLPVSCSKLRLFLGHVRWYIIFWAFARSGEYASTAAYMQVVCSCHLSFSSSGEGRFMHTPVNKLVRAVTRSHTSRGVAPEGRGIHVF